MARTPEENERIVRTGFRDKARRTIGRVPFVEEAAAAYYCAVDPTTPTRVRLALMAALAYFVVPVDLIPDLIAVLGFTDDAAVFWAAWRTVRGQITEAHRARAREFFDDPRDNAE